jgi:hypothetical protein
MAAADTGSSGGCAVDRASRDLEDTSIVALATLGLSIARRRRRS